MTNPIHANNKTKNVLFLGEGVTQRLDNTILTAEKVYSISFTKINTKFCLSLHYNREDNYLFVDGR